MKPPKLSSLVAWFISLSLVISSLAGGVAAVRVGAQAERSDAAQFPQLSRYASDLTRLARLGKLELAAGLEDDVQRAVEILSRDSKNNPVLLSDSASDASAVARGEKYS